MKFSARKRPKNCLICHGANSTLKARLYRHLAKEEQERLGFTNNVHSGDLLCSGTTRHPLLDTLVLGAFAAAVVGLALHGLSRIPQPVGVTTMTPTTRATERTEDIMAEREYLIAPWIRIWHWTNALLIIILGVTGLSVHFADPSLPLVSFALAVPYSQHGRRTADRGYLFFVVANVVTGNWWQFVPKPPGILHRIIKQAMWYGIGIFRGDPHPART